MPIQKNDYRQKDGATVRQLNILLVFEKCKKYCPMDIEILKSNIQFETGFTRKTLTEFLKILYDTKKILIENDVVSLKVKNEN